MANTVHNVCRTAGNRGFRASGTYESDRVCEFQSFFYDACAGLFEIVTLPRRFSADSLDAKWSLLRAMRNRPISRSIRENIAGSFNPSAHPRCEVRAVLGSGIGTTTAMVSLSRRFFDSRLERL